MDRRKILVVDDEILNLEIMESFISESKTGYEVILATNGEKGIDKAVACQPDLIFMNLMMPPGIDGIEACCRLTKNPATANIPVVIFSASPVESYRVEAESCGAKGCIETPIRADEIWEYLESYAPDVR